MSVLKVRSLHFSKKLKQENPLMGKMVCYDTSKLMTFVKVTHLSFQMKKFMKFNQPLSILIHESANFCFFFITEQEALFGMIIFNALKNLSLPGIEPRT